MGKVQFTPERLAELRRIAEAATPGPWEVTEFAGGEERSPGELGVFAPNHPHSYQKSDGTWYAVVICRGMDGPTREENSEYIATFDPPTVLAMLDEIERLRRVVEEFTDFTEHGGRFVLRPMAETITVNGVVYTPIQWVYDYLEIIGHQIRLQAERVLALLD